MVKRCDGAVPPKWKKELDEEEAQMARREAELNRKTAGGDARGLSNLIRSGLHKVGCNDPCPCGSKKYKEYCSQAGQ